MIKSVLSACATLASLAMVSLGPAPADAACTVGLGAGASLGGMLPFPANNPWNQDISAAQADPSSNAIITRTGASSRLHPDFGAGLYAGAKIGIPYVVVPESQPLVPMSFTAYASESDPGPYPVPSNAPIEGLGTTSGYSDGHVLVVQRDCAQPNGLGKLFELFRASPVGSYPTSVRRWDASNGARFDLNSNTLRPAGWTSADAAGLPIFPGLVRYDEVAAGEIRHALRITVAQARRGYVAPARHMVGSSTDPNLLPMGARLRLKAGVSIAGYPPKVQVILRALKKYGMLVADIGGNWFISGAPDDRWSNDELAALHNLHGSDLEVVKLGTVVTR